MLAVAIAARRSLLSTVVDVRCCSTSTRRGRTIRNEASLRIIVKAAGKGSKAVIPGGRRCGGLGVADVTTIIVAVGRGGSVLLVAPTASMTAAAAPEEEMLRL